VGEELDDDEGLAHGPEEGVEGGGVEVDGGVPLRGGGGVLADAEGPEGVRPWRGGEEDGCEEGGGEGEEARRRRHVDRPGSLCRAGRGSGDPFRTPKLWWQD
jgi:hypothetical protein